MLPSNNPPYPLDSPAKFTSFDPQYREVAHDYGKVFYNEDERRIVIGASANQIDLLLQLAENINSPYYVLYVLLVSRCGNEPGRYQSPLLETMKELESFLTEYKEYFETDGRHHLWVGTLDNSGRLIYDQHNVIFAYGDLTDLTSTLRNEGYFKHDFSFPVPHAHAYNEANDKFEEAILAHWEWTRFPLGQGDEYD